jgi:ATP-dependent Clp protease adaptor protein ClpS
MGREREPESIEAVDDEVKADLEEPPLYRVLLHNDDYTTMEFVVEVLMVVFNKSMEAATLIMLNVHKKGVGLCGIYPFEIAETKVDTVGTLARENGFPLRCSMERES